MGSPQKPNQKLEKREGKKSIKDNTFRKGRRSLFLLYRLSRERTEGFEARDLSERGWSELLREGKGRRRRRIGSRARRLRYFPFFEKNFTTSTSTSVRPRNPLGEQKLPPRPVPLPPFSLSSPTQHHARGPPGQGRPRRGHDHLLLHVPRAVKGGDDGAQARGARGENGVFLFFLSFICSSSLCAFLVFNERGSCKPSKRRRGEQRAKRGGAGKLYSLSLSLP